MIRTISFRVICKRDAHRERTCFVHADIESGKPRFGLSNGCEEMSGDPACTACILALNALYNSDAVIPDEPLCLP